MRNFRQIAILLTAALVAAHPLECPTAAIATVTVLEQQLIIVQEPQALPWTYAIINPRSLVEPQATHRSDSRSPGKPHDSNPPHAMTSSRSFLDKYLTIAMTKSSIHVACAERHDEHSSID